MTSMSESKRYRSGEKSPASGQVRIVGTKDERTVVKGEPMPPTPKSRQSFVFIDRTRNGAGRGK